MVSCISYLFCKPAWTIGISCRRAGVLTFKVREIAEANGEGMVVGVIALVRFQNHGKRKVEVLTSKCPVCQGVVDMVNELACPHCDVAIYNLNKNAGVDEAKECFAVGGGKLPISGALQTRTCH